MLAQQAERRADTPMVAGSTPVLATFFLTKIAIFLNWLFSNGYNFSFKARRDSEPSANDSLGSHQSEKHVFSSKNLV